MALTRVTQTVVEDSAITADKIADGAVTTAKIADGAINLSKLAATANYALLHADLSTNVNLVQTNVVATQSNVSTSVGKINDLRDNAVRDFQNLTANINTVSGNVSTTSAANDFITFTRLNANINSVKANVDAAEANIAGILDGTTFTGEVTMNDDLTIGGNLTVAGQFSNLAVTDAYVNDRIIMLANGASGAPSLDVGLQLNRGNQGNVFVGFDESADEIVLAVNQDPPTNTAISIASYADLQAAKVTASSVVVPNDGDLGSTGATDAIQISSGGIVTFKDDIKIKDGGTIGTATTPATITIAADGDSAFSGGLGVAGNTAPAANSISVGTPANVIITANHNQYSIVIGDPTNQHGGSALDVRGTANVGVLTTQGVDPLANDFATFTRLNANINVVQGNVAALSGSIQLHPFTNVVTQSGTANTFFLGKAMPGDGLANVLSVSIDGIDQQKDQPGTANNDFIMNAVASHASIKFTAPSIPAGSKIQTLVLYSG